MAEPIYAAAMREGRGRQRAAARHALLHGLELQRFGERKRLHRESRHGTTWDTWELALLRHLPTLGAYQLSWMLGRSEGAIEYMYSRQTTWGGYWPSLNADDVLGFASTPAPVPPPDFYDTRCAFGARPCRSHRCVGYHCRPALAFENELERYGL